MPANLLYLDTARLGRMTPRAQAAHRDFCRLAAAEGGSPLIERVIILRDDLWPRGTPLPQKAILPWIEEQHNQGLWVTLVREGNLASETELLCDMGIYGDRALGIQELDEHARTVRFTLLFDAQNLRLARDRWEKLGLYTISLTS